MTTEPATLGPFDAFRYEAWPHRFRVELVVNDLHGPTPRNPDVVRSWLMAKAGITDEAQIEAEITRIFVVDPTKPEDEAAAEAIASFADRHVNGFKRDSEGLYMEGRQLKACIKEAAAVCLATGKLPGKFGLTNKGTKGFIPEHVMVPDDRLHLGRQEHDDHHTRFVTTWRGQGITVEEVCYDAKISARVWTDYAFTDKQWAMIWLTAEQIGLGASRSQGFGKFTVVEWAQERGRKPEK